MILLAILSNLQFERLDKRFPNFKGNFISANAPPSGHRGYDNCLIVHMVRNVCSGVSDSYSCFQVLLKL